MCKLTFFAPYWLDNRTGLDLVFTDHQSAPQSPLLLGTRLPWERTNVYCPGTVPHCTTVSMPPPSQIGLSALSACHAGLPWHHSITINACRPGAMAAPKVSLNLSVPQGSNKRHIVMRPCICAASESCLVLHGCSCSSSACRCRLLSLLRTRSGQAVKQGAMRMRQPEELQRNLA